VIEGEDGIFRIGRVTEIAAETVDDAYQAKMTNDGISLEKYRAVVLADVIHQKLDNTIYWLNKAYDARPRDGAVEKTLLELMAALKRLKVEADAALLRPEVREVHPGRRRQPRDHFKNVAS